MNYLQPKKIEEAVLLAQSPGAFFLAGGTDLILQVRKGKVYPHVLIDLGKIPELRSIEVFEDYLIIGSMVTFDDCLRSVDIRDKAFALWQACQTMGSPQIRHQATIGGNLGNCSPAADALPPLLVLGTLVELVSAEGKEVLPLSDLLERNPMLKQGTLVKAFRIPLNGLVSGFSKLGRRQALSISRLSVAISLKPIDKRPVELRIALGAVGKRPFLANELTRNLQGKVMDEEWIQMVCSDAQHLVKDILGSRASAPYKSVAVGGVIRKALTQVIDSIPGTNGSLIVSKEGETGK